MFRLIWNLCLLRARPDAVPYSIPLLMGVIVIHFSTTFFIISIASTSLWTGTWKTLLFEVCVGVCTAVLLRLHGMAGRLFKIRLTQTLISLFGTNTVILALTAVPYI